MNIENNQISDSELEAKSYRLIELCREKGLKVTPQRVAIYQELVKAADHPSADILYKRIKADLPNISLDTVNRTLLTFADIGAAFVVEGSGEPKRFDAELEDHLHFKCLKCRKIIDFHRKSIKNIEVPEEIAEQCKVLRKAIYFEGICERCLT
ncbi:MAG: Fur family transcriptional regulator [Planctomycetota bacterium]|jgi:Fur family peroxide stress response transcriptional regulator